MKLAAKPSAADLRRRGGAARPLAEEVLVGEHHQLARGVDEALAHLAQVEVGPALGPGDRFHLPGRLLLACFGARLRFGWRGRFPVRLGVDGGGDPPLDQQALEPIGLAHRAAGDHHLLAVVTPAAQLLDQRGQRAFFAVVRADRLAQLAGAAEAEGQRRVAAHVEREPAARGHPEVRQLRLQLLLREEVRRGGEGEFLALHRVGVAALDVGDELAQRSLLRGGLVEPDDGRRVPGAAGR